MAISVQFQLGEMSCAMQQDGPSTPEFAETLLRIAADRAIAAHTRLMELDGYDESEEIDPEVVEQILKAATLEEPEGTD